MSRFASIERIAAKVDGIIAAKTAPAPAPAPANHAPSRLSEPKSEQTPATARGGDGGNFSHIEQVASPTTSPKAAGSTKPKRYDYSGGAFEVSKHGVFFLGTDKEGNEQPPKWICSKLEVLASTRDTGSKEWGRLLAWEDGDGVAHRWPLPMELLQGDGLEMRRELARLGLQISPTKAARDLLAIYVQVWPAQSRARCVDKLGWHGAAYVTPSEAIGDDEEITVFQSTQAIEPAFSVSGTVASWGGSVAAMAAGNSRMVFAISTAFAASLLDLLGEESGGFHLRGGSSMGKTTALKVAASIWGNPKRYPRLWRATANGLEGLAALHNDGLLILDELSQAEPSAAGEAAYMLANGQGKTRAAKTGAARAAASWRLLFLSSGEESLGGMMRKAGKTANAGQEIRLADIEADAGAGLGAFENIHDHQDAAAFALALHDAALEHHGATGMEWLRRIVADRASIVSSAAAQARGFAQQLCPPESTGQVQRVARRFALVGLAGEMATAYGLTGWQAGESQAATQKCFDAWLEGFGGASPKEGRAIVEQVRGFIELHGASRFEDLGSSNQPRIISRAGFIRTDSEGRNEYLILPTVFKNELCKGFDLKAVCKALHEAGALQTKEVGRYAQKPRIAGHGLLRVYVLSSRIMEGD